MSRAGAPRPWRAPAGSASEAEGLSNRESASRPDITDRALERHVTAIFEKLGLPADRERRRRVLAVLHYVRTRG